MTPGPAFGTAALRTMKIPVPIVAPTPSMVSWNRPIVRLSSPPSVVAPVSATNAETGFRRNSEVRMSVMPPTFRGTPGGLRASRRVGSATRRGGQSLEAAPTTKEVDAVSRWFPRTGHRGQSRAHQASGVEMTHGVAVDVLGERRGVARPGLAAAVRVGLAQLPRLVPPGGVGGPAGPRHRPPRAERPPAGAGT